MKCRWGVDEMLMGADEALMKCRWGVDEMLMGTDGVPMKWFRR